jgi:molybdenum cofactor cytidylyltransferase
MSSTPESGAAGIGAVVLAAGRSRRMGAEKIRLPFGGSTVLETVLETLSAAGVDPAHTVVVLRPDLEDMADAVRRRGASAVWNPDSDAAMMSSIRVGLEAIPSDLDALFVWPADHPAVSPGTVRGLALRADPTRVWIPVWNGRRGHPALLGRDLLAPAAAQSDDEGLRELWRSRADAVYEWPVDDAGVVANADSPEEYERARALWESRRS